MSGRLKLRLTDEKETWWPEPGLAALMLGRSAALAQTGQNVDWPLYLGDASGSKYKPLDQINASNFTKLEVAWRFKTDNIGNRPEFKLEGTPLEVGGVVYATAGSRRAVVALDAVTGELLWVHGEKEGARGAAAPRQIVGPRPRLLERRQGSAHPLCHAGLSADRAGRQDRPARSPPSATTARWT